VDRIDSSAPFLLDPSAHPAVEAEALRRRGCPVQHVVLPGDVEAVAAMSYETVQQVLSDPRLTKDPKAWKALEDGLISPDWELIALVRGAGMLHAEGPDHRRLRGLTSKAFKRTPVGALRPRIEAIAQDLLDSAERVAGDGPVDLRELFAFPLPVRVICEILGVPTTAVTGLRAAFDRLVTPREADSGLDGVQAALGAIYGELPGLIALKRQTPGDDLATALIQARDEDANKLSDEELVQTVFLLLIAGHETTVNLLTSTVQTLLKNPSLVASVHDGAHSWAEVVEEGLRHSSPVRYGLMRYATEDVEIGGVKIARGEPVIVGHYAASRDPEVHENPEQFDLDRTSHQHLAFGHGAHYCLGAALARLEAEVALRLLFTRFPELRLASDKVDSMRSISLQGITKLPVYLHPANRPQEPQRAPVARVGATR
jgi:cytochrome P450